MKCLAVKISLLFLMMMPSVTFAVWQVVSPQSAVPTEPFFQSRTHPHPIPATPVTRTTYPTYQAQPIHTAAVPVPVYSSTAFPARFANLGRPAAIYAISVSGSLKENVERIMDRYHWKVIWKVPYDYNFDGRVTGASLPNVIEKLLQPFPLQAQMYMSNRTMTVIPRKV